MDLDLPLDLPFDLPADVLGFLLRVPDEVVRLPVQPPLCVASKAPSTVPPAM